MDIMAFQETRVWVAMVPKRREAELHWPLRMNLVMSVLHLIILKALEWTIHVAEARMCQSQSHMYHEACLHDHNCTLVCRNEGFSGG
ncbi:defensin-like protein 1, partial [Tanacetum coccineum]